MKVGVDAMLLGAWACVEGEVGLDVGCGCGIISLMAAQRNPECMIDAVDIDHASVGEAEGNFRESPWSERLRVIEGDITSIELREYDFILSNPPFFHSGINRPSSSREKARHEDSLSAPRMVEIASRLLTERGVLSMVFPAEDLEKIKETARKCGMKVYRVCLVTDKPGKKPKRAMTGICREGDERPFQEETLFIRDEEGNYSVDYKSLTKDFYLNF